jgi:hypothetical protein
MKKLLFLTNFALLGVILFMSCNKADLAADTAAVEHNSAANTASKAPCESGNCKACTDHTASLFAGIDPYLARQLFYDYKEQNQPRLRISETIEDANRIWFSLESLKNFIWQIEKAQCEQPCAKEKELKLGIRVYYGRYPLDMHSAEGLRGLPKDYAEHHTLFMVPTFEDERGAQVDFDPWNWGTNCPPQSLRSLLLSGVFQKKNACLFSIAERQYYKDKCGDVQPWMWRGQPLGIMNHGNMEPPPSGLDGSGF